MSASRQNLLYVLYRYISESLGHIDTVRGFCERISTWTETRKGELTKINDKINEEILTAVLKDTLGGLEELDYFLDAVEKLAVTSFHIFKEDNQVLHLPKEINLEIIQVVIIAARLVCPLLLEFKRDAKAFFLPKLQNVEVLSYQLDRYIQTTLKICEKLEKSSISEFFPKMNKETVVELDVDLSEDDIQRMLYHIEQLHEIRMNQNFRMVFLFEEASCSDFTREFSERQPRMLQFVKDLEETAVQLDRMNKGAKISSVAGSSVGAVGGVLSIVGLALIPFTAGASLGLVIGGTALGVTSGVNSAVTTATEIAVNSKYQNKASEVFKSFMEDVQSLQDCLEDVTSQYVANTEKKIELKCLAESPVLDKHQKLVAGAGKLVAQEGRALGNVSRVAAEIPDIGQAAVKGTLALSKAARAGLIGVNALFLGMDIFFICKDSTSLAKGSETKMSQFIRARAALWSSEMDSWKKIHDSLCEGEKTSEKHQTVLAKPFYPERSQIIEKEK